MSRLVEMAGGVLVLGVITAADVSTNQANAQVYPLVADFETILTALCAGRHLTNLVNVCTLLGRHCNFPLRQILHANCNHPIN